ncbi:MAG: RHS repeat-associated core domain-containing protein [Bacteroidia bacterium]
MVGSGGQLMQLNVVSGALNTITSITSTNPAPSTADFHSLWVFRDNSVMTVGANGVAYYYTGTSWRDYSPSTQLPARYSNFTWRDVVFRDDITGWMVGDSASNTSGEIVKTIGSQQIQTPSSAFAWVAQSVIDGTTANNIVTNATQINYNIIAASSPYDLFVGGSYTSTNTSGYPYARLLNDRGGVFSRLIWYDRIGKITVSQTTKQHNYKRPAYTYTFYDELGRIIETGQKIENTDVTTFSTIFGDTVLGFYNPSVMNNTKYLTWVRDNTGPRTEVVHSYYDVQDILPLNVFAQQELRNRLASATYSDTLRTDSTKFNNANHYSYDVLGNIATLIKDDSIYGVNGQRYKTVNYQYDLVASKVNELDYQSGNIDQYHTKYTYDADNRTASSFTSKDSIMWDNDANYFYYAQGNLARIELGDQQVQGRDYAYTLQGWLKGVNSDQLDGVHDMGHDALQQSGNLNRYFARDAMGCTYKYFTGDYDAINKTYWNNVSNRFEADAVHSDVMNARHDLFSADPTAMITTITQPQLYQESNGAQAAITLPQGTAYNYDQLTRLIEMKAYQNLNTSTNTWGTGSTYANLYHNTLTYDANGNILTQVRYDSIGGLMSTLNYQYNTQSGITLQNRLYHVNNTATSASHLDIQDEGTFNSTQLTINQKNNYRYDAMGDLAKDSIGKLDTIIWNVRGKIWKIRKYNGDSLIFAYDANGSRISKEYKPSAGTPVTTYYLRDATENILAIYTQKTIGTAMSFAITERDVYGTGRIGTENSEIELIGSPPVSQIDTFSRYLGEKNYELDNHLGNVLATVSDRKIPRPNSAGDSIAYYEVDIVSANDYYPFGMLEPGRNFNSPSYKYGFNRKLKDDETYGNGDEYDYGERIYDPRLGRFMTVDPLAKTYAMLSTYQFASNTPISAIDLMGLEAQIASYGAGVELEPAGYSGPVLYSRGGFQAEATREKNDWNTATQTADVHTGEKLRSTLEDATEKEGSIGYLSIYTHGFAGRGIALNDGQPVKGDEENDYNHGLGQYFGRNFSEHTLSYITDDAKIKFAPGALVVFAGCYTAASGWSDHKLAYEGTNVYSIAKDFTQKTGIASIGAYGATSYGKEGRTAFADKSTLNKSEVGFHLYIVDQFGKMQDINLGKTLNKETIQKAKNIAIANEVVKTVSKLRF